MNSKKKANVLLEAENFTQHLPFCLFIKQTGEKRERFCWKLQQKLQAKTLQQNIILKSLFQMH